MPQTDVLCFTAGLVEAHKGLFPGNDVLSRQVSIDERSRASLGNESNVLLATSVQISNA
jgi:hypothetical protein